MIFRRVVVAAVITALSTAPVNAVTMREVFDAANTNTTPSGAAYGQAMNYYTGGSLFMRTPNKNYQLASVTPPSFRANSCGSIDAFYGGLSHISATEFVDMLKRIGSGAVAGFAFKLALSAMSPEIKQVMQELHDMAQKINKMNVDSCEVATGIVTATDDIIAGKTNLNAAAMWDSLVDNYAPDFAGAKERIQRAGDQAGTELLNRMKSAMNDRAKASKLAYGNITWQALDSLPDSFWPSGNATNYKLLLMSLIGPIIARPMTKDDDPHIADGDVGFTVDYLPAMLDPLSKLVGKPNGANKIALDIYVCDSATATFADALCMNPTKPANGVEFDSFMYMTQTRMNSIVNNIFGRSRPDEATMKADIAFVNSTSLPIYKMLSVATQMRNPAVANFMIDKYTEAVAAEYAANFLNVGLRVVREAVENAAGKAGNPTKKAALEKLAERTTALRMEIAADMRDRYSRLATVNNIAAETISLERALVASLPADLQNSLKFQLANQ